MAKRNLTQKQQSVLEFIRTHLAEQGVSPLIREIQFGCGIVSYKSVLDRLTALERKGFITRVPSKHRGIRLPSRRASKEVPTQAVPQREDAA